MSECEAKFPCVSGMKYILRRMVTVFKKTRTHKTVASSDMKDLENHPCHGGQDLQFLSIV